MASSIPRDHKASTQCLIADCTELGFNAPTKEQGAHLVMNIDVTKGDVTSYSFSLFDEGDEHLETIQLPAIFNDDTVTNEVDVYELSDASAPAADDMDIDDLVSPTIDCSAGQTEGESGLEDVQDVYLIYMDMKFPCNSAIVRRESGFFRKILEGVEPSVVEPPCINVPRLDECDSHAIFYAVLEACYFGTWNEKTAFELKFSYLTSVKVWLIGEAWDISALRAIGLNNTFALTKGIIATPTHLLNQNNKEAERGHLASFVRAVKLAGRHPWHAKLYKELYDCGAELAPKLQHNSMFKDFVRTKKEGADFAQATGIQMGSRWQEIAATVAAPQSLSVKKSYTYRKRHQAGEQFPRAPRAGLRDMGEKTQQRGPSQSRRGRAYGKRDSGFKIRGLARSAGIIE